MKILLIAPGSENELDSRIMREIPYLNSKAFYAPYALATVAALTPPEHSVVIHDEMMRGPVDALLDTTSFDVIGVTLTTNLIERALEIGTIAGQKQPDATVVAGGIGAQNILQKDDSPFDVVFFGEAEEIWPQFLADFEKGTPKKVYKNLVKPDMKKVPLPRWELIAEDIPHYGFVSIQTTRGCPFDCSFCDVIYTFGRKPRTKSIDQVLEEVTLANAMQAKMILFADDNFSGNRPYAKKLLRALAKLNNSFTIPLWFSTQLDITIARDEEFLELLADAGFVEVMIGIESVNTASLEEMNKKQNLNIDIKEAVVKIQSYGIAVLGHMIIGTDADDAATFEQTARFVDDANIVHHYCHPLMAPPGTKLWYELARKKRLVYAREEMRDKLDITTNILPAKMSRIELFEGLADYWLRINNPAHYVERAIRFVRGISRQPQMKKPGMTYLFKMRKMIGQTFIYFLFKATPVHRKAFFSLVRNTWLHKRWFMPRAFYIYTNFLMDFKRAAHDAKKARDRARWEREHPDGLVPESAMIPVPQSVRKYATEITATAWHTLHSPTIDKETLYRVAVEAVIDYSDRFGETLETFDDHQKAFLEEACNRALTTAGLLTGNGTDTENPPTGFSREIMDAIDKEIRVRSYA